MLKRYAELAKPLQRQFIISFCGLGDYKSYTSID
jgi:hypothetical protein